MPTKDPDIQTTRITAVEIAAKQKGGTGGSRWFAPGNETIFEDIYETGTPFTLADLLEGKPLELCPWYGSQLEHEDLADIIHTAIYPGLVGDKVSRLMVADIAETQLGAFEASEFNDPAPRVMVDGLRAFAFGKIALPAFELLIDAAYSGENNRSDVSYLGMWATLPWPTKRYTNWSCVFLVKLMEKSQPELEAIVERMKEYEVGTVDLSSELTVRVVAS